MKSLANELGFEKVRKATTNNNTSFEGVIKKEINELIHNFLLEKYPSNYVLMDTSEVVKQDKEGNVLDIKNDFGHRLLVPIDDEVTLKHKGTKRILASAVKVSDPQIYLQGIQNWVCEYVKIGGKTHNWSTKSGQFTEVKTK